VVVCNLVALVVIQIFHLKKYKKQSLSPFVNTVKRNLRTLIILLKNIVHVNVVDYLRKKYMFAKFVGRIFLRNQNQKIKDVSVDENVLINGIKHKFGKLNLNVIIVLSYFLENDFKLNIVQIISVLRNALKNIKEKLQIRQNTDSIPNSAGRFSKEIISSANIVVQNP